MTKELVESDSRMELVTAAIIARGTLYSAADVYQANDHLSDLGSKARMELAKVTSLRPGSKSLQPALGNT